MIHARDGACIVPLHGWRRDQAAAGKVTPEVVEGVRREMRDVQNDPDAVFFFSFVQARATVY